MLFGGSGNIAKIAKYKIKTKVVLQIQSVIKITFSPNSNQDGFIRQGEPTPVLIIIKRFLKSGYFEMFLYIDIKKFLNIEIFCRDFLYVETNVYI